MDDLQAEQPEDWVIATGKTTTVRDFVKMAFQEIGVTLAFKGTGVAEKGIVKAIDTEKYAKVISGKVDKKLQVQVGQEVVAIDATYFRPTEVDLLIGDATKAKNKLGWTCQYDLQDLVKDMMQSDIKLMQKTQLLKDAGYETLNYFE